MTRNFLGRQARRSFFSYAERRLLRRRQPGRSGYGLRPAIRRGRPAAGDEFPLLVATGDQERRESRGSRTEFHRRVEKRFRAMAGGTERFSRGVDATGEPTGDEFQVDSPARFTRRYMTSLSTAMQAIVVGGCRTQLDFDVRAQRLDALGDKLGPLLLVSESTERGRASARVAVGPDGAFVVTWLRGGPASPSAPFLVQLSSTTPAAAARRCVPGERRAARTRPPFSCDRSATQRTVRRRLDGGDGRFISDDVRARIIGVSRSVRSDSMPPRHRRPEPVRLLQQPLERSD